MPNNDTLHELDESTCPGKDGTWCCGCMVYLPYAQRWECGCSYFALVDDGVVDIDDGQLTVDESELTDGQRRYLDHWRTHRVALAVP